MIGFGQGGVVLMAPRESCSVKQCANPGPTGEPLPLPGGIALEFDADRQRTPARMRAAETEDVGLQGGRPGAQGSVRWSSKARGQRRHRPRLAAPTLFPDRPDRTVEFPRNRGIGCALSRPITNGQPFRQ